MKSYNKKKIIDKDGLTILKLEKNKKVNKLWKNKFFNDDIHLIKCDIVQTTNATYDVNFETLFNEIENTKIFEIVKIKMKGWGRRYSNYM